MPSSIAVVFLPIAMFLAGCATTKPADLSGTNKILERDAMALVMLQDQLADQNICADRKLVNKETVASPPNSRNNQWVEKWAVDRCGTIAYYRIIFTPTPKIGGTDISVSTWK